MTQTILLGIAFLSTIIMIMALYWGNRVFKFLTVAIFIALANSIYFSLDGVKGWPAEEPSEVKGILASIVIISPTPKTEGAIYISLFPTMPKTWYEYEYPRHAPKTYFVEYSNDRASQFQEAKEALKEGKEVRINGIPGKNSIEGQEGDGSMNMYDVFGNALNQWVPRSKDTYKPVVPNIEILEPTSPPQKG